MRSYLCVQSETVIDHFKKRLTCLDIKLKYLHLPTGCLSPQVYLRLLLNSVVICLLLCSLSGPAPLTALSAPQRAWVSGSQPRAKSAVTITGFQLFSTIAPTCGTVGAVARRCRATSRLQTTLQSCPVKCLSLGSWRSLAATSVRGPTIRACWPPHSPVQRNWWRRHWRGEGSHWTGVCVIMLYDLWWG